MYNHYFNMITDEQVQKLHQASLKILEDTGVIVKDKEAIKLLKKGGARVKDNHVYIPRNMVKKAFETAPDSITLYENGGDGKELLLTGDNVYYGLGTDLPKFVDPYDHSVRSTKLQDVMNVAKVTQQSDNIDFVASLGLAEDVPQNLVDLYHYKAVKSYCNKPYLTTATNKKNMKALIDMAAVLSGGYEELKNKPTIALYAEPISPLVNSKEALQKLLLCAEYEIPVTYASGIMASATGPTTLAGSIALGNAEGLAGLVIHQLKNQGAPFIYGLVFSVMDMKTTISCYGGPEFAMGHALASQLGKYYNLPTYGTGGCTDANTVDAQAGMEAMYSNFMSALTGANLVHDNGYLGSGLTGCLEMILLDNEINGFIRRFLEGVKVNKETLNLDIINEIGPGGNFITHEHTMMNFKKETWYPEFLNRKQYSKWEEEGSLSLDKKLNKKAKTIIEEKNNLFISEVENKKMERIINKRKEELNREK